MSGKFNTTEEIRQAFVEDGWNETTSFSELTLNQASEKGYVFATCGILRGRKYFVMNQTGNVYGQDGKICMYNVPNARYCFG